jgi:hypothetical protein
MIKKTAAFRLLLLTLFVSILTGAANLAKAQYLWNDTTAYKAGEANSGRIWGYAFGDFAYKGHADSLSRGGSNQYTGIPSSRTTFQFRRIYIGYDYNITKKFSAELLLTSEDNFPAGNPPAAGTTALSTGNSTGDILTNQKLSFYIKLANVRWKNIWKGTDLVVGQIATPAFPGISEKVWSYRSIERTVSDIRRTPSYDMGAALQGVFDPATKNFGYDVMVGNGTSAKPENDNFKWFYADIYAYLFDKHVVVDAYGDYERLNWTNAWHHSRQMLKGFIAYNSSATSKSMNPGTGYTIGVEGFVNTLKNDLVATPIGTSVTDTLTSVASAISMYIHGDIIKNKLRFFARLDLYNPNNKVNSSLYSKYAANTGNYNDNSFHTVYNYAPATPTVTYTATGDQTYKQTFITAGLDFKPAPRVHFMPNIWYNSYNSQLSSNKDHDIVYRITFFYAFGKNYDNGGF